MTKAQVGDLIRITNPCEGDPYKIGEIYEVISVDEVFDEYDSDVYVKDGNGGELLVCYDEYEIHRKAGEESVCAHCGKTGVHTCRGAEYHAEPPRDAVNSPNHYTQGRFEVIDVIEDAVVGADPFEAVCQANILKYTLRYRHKNGVEDLKKARWYLEKLISVKEVSTNVK